jgi:hypothetical protein
MQGEPVSNEDTCACFEAFINMNLHSESSYKSRTWFEVSVVTNSNVMFELEASRPTRAEAALAASNSNRLVGVKSNIRSSIPIFDLSLSVADLLKPGCRENLPFIGLWLVLVDWRAQMQLRIVTTQQVS